MNASPRDPACSSTTLAWSPDGGWLAIQGSSGLTLFDVTSGRTERLSRTPAFGAIAWGRE